MKAPLVGTVEPVRSNVQNTNCQNDADTLLSVNVPTLVSTQVVNTKTVAGAGGHSEASVDQLNVLAGAVRATAVSSSADASCVNGKPVLTGSSSIANLSLNGGPTTSLVTQSITLPLSPLITIALNEQTKTANTITQRAIHVYSPLLGIDIVVAESKAGVNSCTAPTKPQCSDGVDNPDPEDTKIDAADPGCHTDGNAGNPGSYDPNDNDETDPKPQCSDAVDNADPEDTLVDAADPGCHTDGDAGNPGSYDPNDNDETDKPECSDGGDNDGDGGVDSQDPGCHTDGDPNNPGSYDPNDDNETQYQCNDKFDNDGDGVTDANDPGCHSDGDPNNPGSYVPTDDDETDEVKPQCSDGVDNDDPEDTLVDQADPGCHTDGNAGNPGSYDPNDDDETNIRS